MTLSFTVAQLDLALLLLPPSVLLQRDTVERSYPTLKSWSCLANYGRWNLLAMVWQHSVMQPYLNTFPIEPCSANVSTQPLATMPRCFSSVPIETDLPMSQRSLLEPCLSLIELLVVIWRRRSYILTLLFIGAFPKDQIPNLVRTKRFCTSLHLRHVDQIMPVSSNPIWVRRDWHLTKYQIPNWRQRQMMRKWTKK